MLELVFHRFKERKKKQQTEWKRQRKTRKHIVNKNCQHCKNLKKHWFFNVFAMSARRASKQETREREKKHVVKNVLKTMQKLSKNSSKREVESNLEKRVQKVSKNHRKRAPKQLPKRVKTDKKN